MSLEQVTDGDDNCRRDYLCKNGIHVKVINQQMKHEIVKNEIRNKNKKISDKLYPAPDV